MFLLRFQIDCCHTNIVLYLLHDVLFVWIVYFLDHPALRDGLLNVNATVNQVKGLTHQRWTSDDSARNKRGNVNFQKWNCQLQNATEEREAKGRVNWISRHNLTELTATNANRDENHRLLWAHRPPGELRHLWIQLWRELFIFSLV